MMATGLRERTKGASGRGAYRAASVAELRSELWLAENMSCLPFYHLSQGEFKSGFVYTRAARAPAGDWGALGHGLAGSSENSKACAGEARKRKCDEGHFSLAGVNPRPTNLSIGALGWRWCQVEQSKRDPSSLRSSG